MKIDLDLLKKAKNQAKAESRTVASLIRYAVALYIRKQELGS